MPTVASCRDSGVGFETLAISKPSIKSGQDQGAAIGVLLCLGQLTDSLETFFHSHVNSRRWPNRFDHGGSRYYLPCEARYVVAKEMAAGGLSAIILASSLAASTSHPSFNTRPIIQSDAARVAEPQ